MNAELKKTDIAMLKAADFRGSFGTSAHLHSAAARRRMMTAGFIYERDVKILRGQYRSTLRITETGRVALAEASEAVK